jgi:hypothetical protein
MRKLLSTLILSTILWIPLRSQTSENAAAYLQSLNTEYEQIKEDMWDYVRVVGKGRSARRIERKRTGLIETVQQAKNNIKKMPGYAGDTQLRDSVIAFLTVSDIVLRKDYAKIVDMEAIAEDSYDKMEAYIEAQKIANRKLKAAGDRLDLVKKSFAAQHSINLIEADDRISEKLKESGKVINYYNRIYLAFFKCNKQEAYLIEALNNADVDAMKKHRKKLIQDCDEGIDSLRAIKGYEGDFTVHSACHDLLRFYKNEAEHKFPKLIDFYLQKEKIVMAKTALEAKKKSKRTQEDIDNYNAALDQYNKAVKDFNTTNDYLNSERKERVKAYNKAVEQFMRKQIP